MEVNKKEIFFGIVFCLFLVSVLTIFFPQPYYFINGGIELKGSYDAEADYFANIISTYINGHPLDFLHPGIPINYFSAFNCPSRENVSHRLLKAIWIDSSNSR